MDFKPGGTDPNVVVEAGLDAMMAALDPHSSYLNPDELRESRVVTRGEFGGLGIEVTMEDGFIKVVSPIEGTPAFRAGIQPGDLITHLDGEALGEKTLSQAVKIMRGAPGEPLLLTILRDGVAPFDVRIVRAVIQLRSVRWHMEGDIGYIRVVSFTEKVEPMLERAMDELTRQSAGRMTGIVLDLRNNPGGLLNQSVFVSDSFLDQGTIVAIRERNPRDDRVFEAEEGDLARGLPMVVLINEGSASASEIVASALKDHGRAVVMGRRSFGKGSVQTIQPLPLEGGLRLTTARYYAPSGYTIQARGVGPDIVLSRAKPDNEDEKPPTIRREADLPRALSRDAVGDFVATATLQRENCPTAGPKNEDRDLGCALAYLQAGSTAAFLAAIGQQVSAVPGQ
ncbi:MAG: S41 family peptidase [Magnetovibrio sp.]|nr:S41 family peptidase [Magnetovibrio sp.]